MGGKGENNLYEVYKKVYFLPFVLNYENVPEPCWGISIMFTGERVKKELYLPLNRHPL